MVTVRVMDRSGRPVSGADVYVSWGLEHSSGRTNSSGTVSWDVSGGSGKILVNGREVYRGTIRGTVTVTA